ncbi:1-deoxy-D-xylulose-5-phosphate synthase [Haloimpatiens sp. FM7330]|uniref:1-deoxy-D-xylulose-5-phosphate synthase n=1 Tax=Haloimpatiens sp. FM7330 TaxID=3298610 RepID=UPI00364075B5
MRNLLENYNNIDDVKRMSYDELEEFAQEIRNFLVNKVSKTGGHLASNLGVVELTLSLYKTFNFNEDKLIWDVGHQAYVHKILTGRKDQFDTLRQYGGISGFPKRSESKYDVFEVGHSSTSLSAASGVAKARDLQNKKYEVVAVIGDGALTGGMALEALNDIGYSKSKVIIILNDNQMSIDKNVGGMSLYFSKLRTDPKYNKFKHDFKSRLKKIPAVGESVTASIQRLKEGVKQLVVPGMLFEDMGIKYLGPIDGHNIRQLSEVLAMCKNIDEPVIIHTITKKGKGYKYAEKNPNKFHGIGPFDFKSGEVLSKSKVTYSKVFGDEIIKIAQDNDKVLAVTAAMPDGTGLKNFSKVFPKRFFDVGIAEQHAVTMCAGLAASGFKPVFAVYSTFLQRAYDQVLHDVCLQNLPVIFAIDRAGVVGHDGETHHGIFDISYLSHIPNLTIVSPKCTEELRTMLKWAVNEQSPVAIRYPKGGDYPGLNISSIKELKKGKWEVLCEKGKIALIAVGNMVQKALLVKERLNKSGVECTVINACFIKPIDKELLHYLVQNKFHIVTIEDNIIKGGMGSSVLEYVNELGHKSKVINLGYDDKFVPQGDIKTLHKINNLDVQGITENILEKLC